MDFTTVIFSAVVGFIIIVAINYFKGVSTKSASTPSMFEKKLTLSQMATWVENYKPSEEVRNELNKWLGEHPNATYAEFCTFTQNLLKSSQYDEFLKLLPNAKHFD